jgi:hypothetical protein
MEPNASGLFLYPGIWIDGPDLEQGRPEFFFEVLGAGVFLPELPAQVPP